MEFAFENHPIAGHLLCLTDGCTEIKVALDYGIRVPWLSRKGMDNLYYMQPADRSDGFVTDKGWNLYGGHRFWMTPESDLSYCPDNEPVSYELTENGVILTQKEDPWLHVEKKLELRFEPDGRIHVLHTLKNLSGHTIETSLWGVNSLAPNGKARISFPGPETDEWLPRRSVAVWKNASLGDSRIRFTVDALLVDHGPCEEYFKMGLFSRDGIAVLENLGQRFTLRFPAGQPEDNSDLGCNFELFMHTAFMELETLGRKCVLAPDESASHWEIWQIEAL